MGRAPNRVPRGIGNRILIFRTALGLTQAELGDRIGGITRAAVCALEQELAAPSITSLIALARTFRCSTDYLLGLSKSPRRNA